MRTTRPKLCGKCKERAARAGQAWCRQCHTEYMRTWRGRPPTKVQLLVRIERLESALRGTIKGMRSDMAGDDNLAPRLVVSVLQQILDTPIVPRDTPQPPTSDYTKGCHAARDGECHWAVCPQLRDGEPVATGRHCPLDVGHES